VCLSDLRILRSDFELVADSAQERGEEVLRIIQTDRATGAAMVQHLQHSYRQRTGQGF
jgi:hypothetical protein